MLIAQIRNIDKQMNALKSKRHATLQCLADKHAKCVVGDMYKGVYVESIHAGLYVYDATQDILRMSYTGEAALKSGEKGKMTKVVREDIYLVDKG